MTVDDTPRNNALAIWSLAKNSPNPSVMIAYQNCRDILDSKSDNAVEEFSTALSDLQLIVRMAHGDLSTK